MRTYKKEVRYQHWHELCQSDWYHPCNIVFDDGANCADEIEVMCLRDKEGHIIDEYKK